MNFLSVFRLHRVRQAIKRLDRYGFSSATLNALSTFLAQAAERELYQANPRHWARQIGLDERTLLALIVAGVREELFELAWQAVCPMCKLYNRASNTLGGILQMHYCENCNHGFEVYLDEGIILTVSVTEALRRLSATKRLDLVFRDWINVQHGQIPALAFIILPAFQELSDQQTIPVGQWLGVKRMTVLCLGLRDTAAIYHKHGDAQAYRWVAEYFQEIFNAATREKGMVVRTRGDDVLGVFPDAANALQVLADALVSLSQLNTQVRLTGSEALHLKAGLHTGSGIVASLNGRLDYFGETVNLAARLSELVQDNEVTISQTILNDPLVKTLVEALGELHPLPAKLDDWASDINLQRLTLL